MKPITISPIRDVWLRIRPALEALSAHPDVTWRPEDVYAACLYGDASLWCEGDSFAVLRCVVDEFSGRRILWVWVACGDGLNDQLPRLDAYARERGYAEIRMSSSRPGWHRMPGWSHVESSFKREV